MYTVVQKEYKAFGTNLKFGIRNKLWADELSLEGYYGDYHNEIQNSQFPGLIDLPQLGFEDIVFGNPFGDIVFTSFSQGLNLRYNVSSPAQASAENENSISRWGTRPHSQL